MQENLADQPNTQPLIQQPIPQQNLPQTYIPPTPNNQPNIQQPTNQQPIYVAQANNQPYIVQQDEYGQNLTQSKDINSKYLREKLTVPKIWTWVSFFIHLITCFYVYIKYVGEKDIVSVFLLIITVISVIFSLSAALLVSLSIRKGDGEKYKCAISLYTIYVAIIASLTLPLLIKSDFLLAIIVRITLLPILLFEIITLIILCCYSKEGDTKQISNYQQSIVGQQA